MALFDFFKKKEQNSQKPNPAPSVKSSTVKNYLFSKSELEQYIATLSKMGYLFQNTTLLMGGRNETMKSRLFSYAGILGYYYENEYNYGRMANLVDQDVAVRHALVSNSMRDASHKRKVVAELADNWSDVLQVIFNLQLEPNEEGERFDRIKFEIQAVTSAFEKLSGSKCREPKDPRNVKPRIVTYNPFNITEDLEKSQGHMIPDITNVFAGELIPQLVDNPYSSKAPKDIVADYALSMIKSYYDNAGFVPMLIVDQITGQINQVADMVQRVSYNPYPSLKEYVLSKIYR